MSTFVVNGQRYTLSQNMRLIDFLRDDLGLTSVKEGCSQGACGSCMVLVEGEAKTACVFKTDKLDGKSIVTVEGLSQREKEVYVYAFGEAGAVQCGFCIPGMVISGKALIDKNPDPSEEDVRKAIRRNICRCTGYVKIIQGIMIAAKMLRENLPIPEGKERIALGDPYPRIDNEEKVLGTGKFSDDYRVEGMIYGKGVRVPYPRARILDIHLEKAKAHPGFVKAVLAEDIPYNKHGHIITDWDVLIAKGDVTRFIGDSVVLIAAETKQALKEIEALVEIEYEELEVMDSPQKSLRSDAPMLHPTGNILRREILRFGNVDQALRESKYVVTRKYGVPHQEHAFLEPESALGMMDGDVIKLYTSSQSIYDEQREVARMLQIPLEKVHVHSMLVGGGFGGKEDMSTQHHAALLAWATGRPVRVTLSRDESMKYHSKKHPADIEMTTACDEEGFLTAMRATIITDTGAYASLGGPVLQRACTHAAGPYNYQNIDIVGMAVYTNNPPAGAFRGFGVAQSCFAIEQNINLLAEMVGISPWQFRYQNAIRPGQVLPNGQIADDSVGLAECLEAVKEEFEKHPRAGIACAFKNSGIGVGLPDIGRCVLEVKDEKVHIRTSAACMGQGIGTVCRHVFCQTTGLAPYQAIHERPDTVRTPNAGTTTASRQTLFTGEAVKKAAQLLKADMDQGKSLKDLEGKEYYGEFSGITDPMGSKVDYPKSHVSYSYAVQVAMLNEEGRLEKILAVNDIGQIVNPKAAEGQAEGGVAMGIGYALTEHYRLENGMLKVNFGTLGLPRSTDVPPIDVSFVRGPGAVPEAYGAKGIGELVIIPTAPAIAGAYYKMDGEFRNRLPLANTPYRKK